MKVFLFLGCLVYIIIATTSAQDAMQQDSSPAQTNPDGLLHFIMSPIRAGLRGAQTFINNRLENVRDGVEMTRRQTFMIFAQIYNKTYSAEEIPRRMALFFRRRQMIDESVKMYREGKLPFAMKENEFADWDENELRKLTGVSVPSLDQLDSEERELDGLVGHTPPTYTDEDEENELNLTVRADKVPAKKDWRNSGCVSTPINQMKCGACYAIATMSVVESMKCINQKTAPQLSPQQIVDCATPRAGYQNFGCDGGWPTRVLKYLQDNTLAARESCYPFIRKQQTCKMAQMRRASGCTVEASSTPGRRVQYKVLHNERDILYHVAKTGPVVTVMKASDKFLFYGPGIFDDPTCSNRRDDVDHAIVITGYGKENGVDYWVIKNSWGVKEWGEDGYAKYRRGKNACSIGHWGWVVDPAV